MTSKLRDELNAPSTTLGKRYMLLLLSTIVASVFFLFFSLELPQVFHHTNSWVVAIELIFLVLFSVDLVLRLISHPFSDWKGFLLLGLDFLAIVPSALVVFAHWGLIPEQNLEVLSLLRLFRLLRVLQLLRMSHMLTEILGVSVFSLVFANMASHLGLRVLVSALDKTLQLNVYQFIERPVLLLAVTAVGSVMGIAMAITFGVVNRKRDDVTEMHRATMDAVDTFERDFRDVFENVSPEQREGIFGPFRRDMAAFLKAKLSYKAMNQSAIAFLDKVRAVVKARPSMDVPFHAVLVQRVSGFLTKSQIAFPAAFYGWLGLLANLYFVLVMMATPGITGMFVQLLVIFVFQGLFYIIQDMDYPLDADATMFNSKILD
jgi:voltage-gated potassium channel